MRKVLFILSTVLSVLSFLLLIPETFCQPILPTVIDTAWVRQTWDITSIAFHPNSQIMAVGNIGNYVGIWDVTTGFEIQKYQGGTPWTVFFSKTGKYIVHGGNEGYFIRDFANDSIIFEYKYPAVVALSDDERYFATAINNNS